MPELDKEKFKEYWRRTEVIREYQRMLYTFGDMELPYVFAAEHSRFKDRIVVRKGVVLFQKPHILLPRYYGGPEFREGFEHANAIPPEAVYLFRAMGLPYSPIAHSSSRRISAVFNQQGIQKKLRNYELQDMNWEGPPAISSYLLWIAKSRSIPGVSLWPEIPFYLAAVEDFQAIKLTLSFLDKRFNLDLDFRELDEEIREQNKKITQLRGEDSEINKCIGILESKLSLSEEEQMELTMKITELLEKRG